MSVHVIYHFKCSFLVAQIQRFQKLQKSQYCLAFPLLNGNCHVMNHTCEHFMEDLFIMVNK